MDKVFWGFIGCGSVVENKSGMAFISDNSEIHAIMRRNIEKAKFSAKKFHASSWYDNVEDLLSDEKVNAVYIATPPGLHFKQAIECCKAGKPTYIEKPLAKNYKEALQLVNFYKESGIPLFVAHYRRALQKFIKIREIINSGKIGKILEVDFRLNRSYDKDELINSWLYDVAISGGGRFYDLAPHSIDIMVYLFGNFSKVYGLKTNNNPDYEVEDIVTMCFETENGILGSTNFNFLAFDEEDKMIVHGENGIISFSIHGNNDIMIKTVDEIDELTISTPKFIEESMIREVTHELLTGKKHSTCSGEEALETYRIIDEVLNNDTK
ncbi:MAG: Gfo/Idh/MocA family oxidoreductase [Oscillospiraceae bacterium]|nr:Gfo/Idh/MocA family oxidoreductase [Oscillospiraceae bacterium]